MTKRIIRHRGVECVIEAGQMKLLSKGMKSVTTKSNRGTASQSTEKEGRLVLMED